jgi:hypothetical protein
MNEIGHCFENASICMNVDCRSMRALTPYPRPMSYEQFSEAVTKGWVSGRKMQNCNLRPLYDLFLSYLHLYLFLPTYAG